MLSFFERSSIENRDFTGRFQKLNDEIKQRNKKDAIDFKIFLDNRATVRVKLMRI